MGNSESDLNQENLFSSEKILLKLSGIDQIEQKDVIVGKFEDKDVCIHTLIFGDDSKPVLVLIHGYASSGALFMFQLAKTLCENFCVITLDIIGMGGSSRINDYDCEHMSPEETNDFFNDYIERWRQAMSLTEFYLAGHSYGGFLAGNYAVKYPEKIKKLLLISPVGIAVKTPQEMEDPMARYQSQARGPPLKILKIAKKWIWEKKISAFKLAKILGRKNVIRNMVIRDQIQDENTKEIMTQYMYQIFSREGTTEYAIQVNFNYAMDCKTPLADKLVTMPFDFSFIFGENDWVRQYVDKNASKDCVKIKGGVSKYYEVPGATHNLHFSNPDVLAQMIIYDLKQ